MAPSKALIEKIYNKIHNELMSKCPRFPQLSLGFSITYGHGRLVSPTQPHHISQLLAVTKLTDSHKKQYTFPCKIQFHPPSDEDELLLHMPLISIISRNIRFLTDKTRTELNFQPNISVI